MQKSVDIFLGYAAEDRDLCMEVKKRLKLLEREGLVRTWHDCTISPGVEREGELQRYLEMAHVILLFISADFIDSDFCYGTELKQAMDRQQRGNARVIPIILRSVYWQETPLGKLQALPRGHKPVKSWSDRDEVLTEIEKEMRMVIKDLLAEEYLQEGLNFWEQKQYKETAEACESALRYMPDSVLAYRLKGRVLLKLERYNEALGAYDQVIHLGSAIASIYIASVYKEKGDAFFYLKQYENALSSYKEAISLGPDLASAYKGASKALRELARGYNRSADEYDERANHLLKDGRNNTQEDF